MTEPPNQIVIDDARAAFSTPGCAVVKVGSNVLVGKSDGIVNRQVFCGMVASLARLHKREDQQVLLVSSGAVAVGRRSADIALANPPMNIKQALAAIGQPILMHLYNTEFGFYDTRVAQLLLTRDDLGQRTRYLHARQTLRRLAELGDVIPIINENDTVASDELQFGDNDQLAALITTLAGADALLILSDVDGVYTGDPRTDPDAVRIDVAYADDDALTPMVDTVGVATYGTGGMASKLKAARIAAAVGIPTIIAPGREPGIIERVFNGEPVGTLLLPRDRGLGSRKAWLRFGGVPAGRLHVDAGVRDALAEDASLLPIGITRVEGDFKVGETVEIVDETGTSIGQGLTAYASSEIQQIAGRRSTEIRSILGYSHGDAVIHRDDLART